MTGEFYSFRPDERIRILYGDSRKRIADMLCRDMIIRGEAPQGTYWAVGANKTIDDKGSTYSRPEEWQFAIKSAWA